MTAPVDTRRQRLQSDLDIAVRLAEVATREAEVAIRRVREAVERLNEHDRANPSNLVPLRA